MKEISKISILLSFLALWITSRLQSDYQTLIGFFFIFSFGILHGANDLVLIKNLDRHKNRSFLTFLSLYVVVVLISAVLFTIVPFFALLIFVLISAYHFGEQHFQDLPDYKIKLGKPLFFMVYGSFVLLLLFYFHSDEVQQIIFGIARVHLNFIGNPLMIIISGLLLVAMMVYNYFYLPDFKKNLVTEIIYLLVFAVIFKLGSLIWGFAIYFILWHSIPSLYDQIKFLYGKYSFPNFILYFKSAFVYWVISLFGIALLYYFLKDEKIFEAIFSAFIAAITFPHAFVILKMFQKNETKIG